MSGPWKGSVQECKGIPGQGNGKVMWGDRVRNQGLWDFQEGDPGKEKYLKCTY